MELLTPKEAAEILKVSTGTLANWRCSGKGPKYIKFNKTRIRYKTAAIKKFIGRN
jgi:predicted site-specific integrase-resolvase